MDSLPQQQGYPQNIQEYNLNALFNNKSSSESNLVC
nr:MAG TPA: hypothetical protein [Caudoviricetes sp.]